MYRIKFYADEQGKQPTRDYLKELGSKADKDNGRRYVGVAPAVG